MRLLGTITVLCFTFCPTSLLSQDWRLEGDLVLASAYDWRGLRLDPGANLQYSAYGSAAWARLRLTAGVWSLADLSSDPSTGLPQRWGAETNPWIEAAVGDVRNQLFLGTVGYLLKTPETGPPLRREDTWEMYVGSRGVLPQLPLLGEAALYWDMTRGDVGYAEVAAALQIPLWVGSLVPLGSLFLEGRSGFSLGQGGEGSASESGEALSREQGLTHVDLSLRTTLMPVPVGPLSVSLTLASHWIRALEEETKRIGSRVGGPVDSARWAWVLGARVLLPRCRPEKELCRDL